MEVSMPTGSLCAERNVIGTALADDVGLMRQHIKFIAVYSHILNTTCNLSAPEKSRADSLISESSSELMIPMQDLSAPMLPPPLQISTIDEVSPPHLLIPRSPSLQQKRKILNIHPSVVSTATSDSPTSARIKRAKTEEDEKQDDRSQLRQRCIAFSSPFSSEVCLQSMAAGHCQAPTTTTITVDEG
jgi:hypothetical protein